MRVFISVNEGEFLTKIAQIKGSKEIWWWSNYNTMDFCNICQKEMHEDFFVHAELHLEEYKNFKSFL